MRIYKTTRVVNVNQGHVLLSDEQAGRRKHLLVKTGGLGSVKLTNAELDLLGDRNYSVYRVIKSIQFKVGEVIGCDGELTKAQADELMPAAAAIDQIAAESAIDVPQDAELIDAILSLESDNPAHFSATTGKPDLSVLSGLLDRKVSGKERDEAWQIILSRETE